MKKWLSYLLQSLFAITLFLGYSVTVNAATYYMNYQYSQQYYDNSGSTVTKVSTTWNESLQSYISGNITTVSSSYGAGLAITSPIPIISNHTYTISIYFDEINNIALSSKNHIAISTSLNGAANNYASGNYWVDTIQGKVNNNTVLQFVFTAKGAAGFLFIPWTTTSTVTQDYVLTQVVMEDLGSEGISQEDINNSLTNQTTEIQSSISSSTNTITGAITDTEENITNSITETEDNINQNIDDMEDAIVDSNNQTQEVIKDQFNSCHISSNAIISIRNSLDNQINFNLDVNKLDNNMYLKFNSDGNLSNVIVYITRIGESQAATRIGTISIVNGINNFNFSISDDILNEIKNTTTTTPNLQLFISSGGLSSLTITDVMFSSYDIDYEPYGEEVCTNKLDEQNETSKGIWETLKSIPSLILDGIEGLFVPSEDELQSLIDEFKSTMETKLGAVYQVTDMLIDVFKSIFSPTERNSCITFPEIKDPMFDKLLIEETDYCFDTLRTDFAFLFTISDMIISIVCTLAFGNMLYKKFEGFIGGDTSDY